MLKCDRYSCEFCKRDQPNICANLKYCGLDPTDGTLCQYFVCGAHMLVPIPDAISWEEAGAIQPLAIAVQVSKRASFREGQAVAVL
jgi:D-xylulose reductase